MAEPAPRTLVLVRHGRTSWNAAGRAQGHADVELDDRGREQVRRLAARFAGRSCAALWSSDLSRASESASVLAAAMGVPVRLDPRLREFDVGERQGLTEEEYAERFPDQPAGLVGYVDVPAPIGAETADQVRERVSEALHDLLTSMDPGETAVVVTHGAALRVALLDLLGWPWEQVRGLAPVRNAHWSEVLVHDSGHAVLAAYNAEAGPDFPCGAGVR